MGIQVRQSNQVQASRLNIGPGAPRQRVLNTQNTVDQQNLQTGLKAAGGAADAFLKKQIEDDEARKATSLVAYGNDYFEATRAFEAEAKDKYRGESAPEYVEALQQFHKGYTNENSGKYAGDPQMQLMQSKTDSQLYRGSMGRADSHVDTETRIWRADTTDGATATALKKIGSNWRSDATAKGLSQQHFNTVSAMNPGRDMTAYQAKFELKIATTRIGSAIAAGEIDEAERLLYGDSENDKDNGYIPVLGESSDNVIKQVEDARITHDATRFADQIFVDMPDASQRDKVEALKTMTDDPRTITAGIRKINTTHNSYAAAQSEIKRDTVNHVLDMKDKDSTPDGLARAQAYVTNISDTATRLAAQDALDRSTKHPAVTKEGALAEFTKMVANGATDQELRGALGSKISKLEWGQAMEVKSLDAKQLGLDITKLETKTLPNAFKNMGKIETKARTTAYMLNVKQWVIDTTKGKNGVPPTSAELEAHTKRMNEQIIYDEDRFTPDETIERYMFDTLDLDQIDAPQSARPDIYQELKAAGAPITEANINAAYYYKISKGLL